jgi:hypothetical protein
MIANQTTKTDRARWWTVVVFAAAMAWVESAVVYYLRTMIHRIEPYQLNPLPVVGGLGPVEMVRELATMIMLFTVGLLAGRTWRSRLGYSAIAFGVWDISYYVFLKLMCDWPHSLFDWDILFLLPLPWWGPVLAPVSIALLLIVWGTLASRFERVRASTTSAIATWGAAFIGCLLALGLFMTDTMRAADGGVDAIRNVLPNQFNWPLFLVALALMTAPVVELCRRIIRSGQLEAAVRLQSPGLTREDQT